jgi:hypothetical protein
MLVVEAKSTRYILLRNSQIYESLLMYHFIVFIQHTSLSTLNYKTTLQRTFIFAAQR